MRQLYRDSILLDLSFVICVFAIFAVAYLSYNSTLYEQERENRAGIIHSIEKVIDTFIVSETEKIRFFIPLLDDANPGSKQIETLLGEVKSVRSVYNVNMDFVVNRIVYSEHPNKEYLENINLTPSQIAHDMEKALSTKQTVITALHSSIATGKYSFSFLFPHHKGILIAEVDLENILNVLSKTGILTTYRNSVVLITRPVNGQVLYSSDEQLFPFMHFSPPAGELVKIDNEQYYYTTQDLSSIGLSLVILTTRSAFETFSGMMRRYLYLILLSLCVLTFIRWYWTKRAVLKPLAAFVHHVSDGGPGSGAPAHLYREWNILESAYDKTRKSLELTSANLKASSDFLSRVINAVPASILVVDEHTKIRLWNQTACELAGMSPGALPVNSDAGSLYMALKPLVSEIQNALQFQKPGLWRGLSVITDNTTFYYDVILSPLELENKLGGVIIIMDVTEQMRKDLQLQQAQKMDMIGNLAGGFAHDFNNILGGISAAVEMMGVVLQNPSLDQNKLMKYQIMIHESVMRAAEMVQQLLTLSRKRELTLRPCDLRSVLRNVEKIAERTLLKSVTIHCELPDESARINADIARLEQVFLNLLINASHAMTIMRKDSDNCGGIIGIKLRRVMSGALYHLNSAEKANASAYWKVSVSDSGVGIKKENLGRIFDPFFTTKAEGTGLGLSMVYNIINHHQGFIDVHSEENAGSTFNVYIPECACDPESEDATLRHETIEPGEGGILIADDDTVMRSVAASFLQECGYNVWTASDGEECVKMYRVHGAQIDLVLLDMVMPKLSGYESYLQLKQLQPAVKVILCSGFKQDQRVVDTLKNGASGFLQKPYSLSDLSREIHKLLAQGRD